MEDSVMEQHCTCGLIMATLSEAKPFINGLTLREIKGRPFPVFSGPDGVLVVCGIGKANAAMGTAYCCMMHDPLWVINLGAAGAVGGKAELGHIYQISEIFEPDRPDFKIEGPSVHTPNTLDGFPTATLATQDRPILEPADRQTISRIAKLVDMEAASVVQACRKFDKKCMVFKFVSDTREHTEGADIYRNIKKYRYELFNYFRQKILPVLENKG